MYSLPVRKDRGDGRKRGGVLIAVHKDLTSVESYSPADCEIAWAKFSHT